MNKLLVQTVNPLRFNLINLVADGFKAEDNTRWRWTLKGQLMKIIFSARNFLKRLATVLSCLLIPFALTYGQAIPLSRPLTAKWSYPSEALTSVAPASGEEAIYVPLTGGRLISLGTRDGELMWNAEVGGEVSLSPSLDSQSLYVASVATAPSDVSGEGRPSGVLRALSRSSGIALWVRTFPSPLEVVLAANGQLFVSSIGGTIYAIDKRAGGLQWTVQPPHKLSSPISISGTRLLFGTEDGYLIALDQKTGDTLWRYQTPEVVRFPVMAAGHLLFFGTSSGYVYSISEQVDSLVKLWRQRAGTGVQSVQLTPQGILVTTQDNFVMLFTSKRGKRLWKKQLPARVNSPPLLGDDGALFAPVGEEACIALSLSDGRQINTLFIGKDNSPVASPFTAGGILFVSTRAGLLAFAATK
jgi:outer membrane protein assembly factor BamB